MVHHSALPVHGVRGLLVCAALLAGSVALAEPEPDAAHVQAAAREFDAGRRAFQLEDFASAAAHFENAFRDVPSPEALRLAIRANARAGDGARAATLAGLAIEKYAGDRPTVELARAFLQELEPKLHRIQVRCEPACSVVIDQRAVFDEAAAATLVYVEPGKHTVSATWPGGPGADQQVEGAAGAVSRVVLRPPADSPAPATSAVSASPEADSSRASGLPPLYTYVGIGVTTALAGATIWSGVDTRNDPGRDVVEARCLDLGESCPEYQDGLDKQRRTNVLLGVTAGCALATGVVALLTDWNGSEQSETSLQPVVLVGGSGVVASGRF